MFCAHTSIFPFVLCWAARQPLKCLCAVEITTRAAPTPVAAVFFYLHQRVANNSHIGRKSGRLAATKKTGGQVR